MKKNIPPPENWQDFESLCKKLFGELWQCEHTIKKNGRLGQSQAGVDVYARPKNESEYFGIQCKGKDNFLEKRLTPDEIDKEIEKAKAFQPALKTFVIATTAVKDAAIEEYARNKDIENSKAGSFGIVLYSWQDLEDLIFNNRDTYNWYVNNIDFKQRFDVKVSIDTGIEGNVAHPIYLKKIKRYEYVDPDTDRLLAKGFKTYQPPWMTRPYVTAFGLGSVNRAWCKLEVTITNTGSITLEDWKLRLHFSDNTRSVDDDLPTDSFIFNPNLKPSVFAYKEDKRVVYKPYDNSPLIQKDHRTFTCYFMTSHSENLVTVRWHLLARDFDQEGTIEVKIDPQFSESVERIAVTSIHDEKEETEIDDLIESVKSK